MKKSPTSAAPPAGASEGPWILIIDDEPSMRVLIEMILTSQGWSCAGAEGAESAVEALKSRTREPSLIICDVLMPGVDGLSLVRRLQSLVPGAGIIFISGRMSDMSWWPEDLRDRTFLEKPFKAELLVAAVRDALSGGGKLP
jgi:two-component system nitrogen regulation response regulator NtrX